MILVTGIAQISFSLQTAVYLDLYWNHDDDAAVVFHISENLNDYEADKNETVVTWYKAFEWF